MILHLVFDLILLISEQTISLAAPYLRVNAPFVMFCSIEVHEVVLLLSCSCSKEGMWPLWRRMERWKMMGCRTVGTWNPRSTTWIKLQWERETILKTVQQQFNNRYKAAICVNHAVIFKIREITRWKALDKQIACLSYQHFLLNVLIVRWLIQIICHSDPLYWGSESPDSDSWQAQLSICLSTGHTNKCMPCLLFTVI